MPGPNAPNPVAPMASYDYALIRVVPRVERGEFINAGVALFCRTRRFLQVRVALDPARLHALAPTLKLEETQAHLDFFVRICAGEGPIGQLPQADRFHWITAPHSTIIQASPVHSGLCTDPVAALEHLLRTLVSVDDSTYLRNL